MEIHQLNSQSYKPFIPTENRHIEPLCESYIYFNFILFFILLLGFSCLPNNQLVSAIPPLLH